MAHTLLRTGKGQSMQLQKELKKEQNARVSVRVTVDKSSVKESMDAIVQDLEKHSKIPGFRRGKVPMSLILTHFSQYIKDETTSRVLSQSLQQVLGEEPYRPISDPVVVEMGDLNKDQDFSYRAQFDVMPAFALPEYKGIASEKYAYKVRDEDITREIGNLRERFATLATKEGKAENGDYLVLDYAEYDTNENPRTKKKDQTVLLDVKNDPLSGLLAGMAKGDEKSIQLPLEKAPLPLENGNKAPEGGEGENQSPETGPHAEGENPIERSGEPGTLYVLVKEVKKKELPELNDEFARDISDAETMEELRKKIGEDLEKTALQRGEEKTKDELITKLVEKTSIELPETLVSSEIAHLLANIATAYRVDPKKLMADQEFVQRYRKSLTPQAVRNVKYELIMNEIVKKELLESTEEDIDEEIRKYARIKKRDFQSVKENMVQNNSIEQLKTRLRQNKALDLVYRSASFGKTRELHFDEQGGNE
jgi:trigger factor